MSAVRPFWRRIPRVPRVVLLALVVPPAFAVALLFSVLERLKDELSIAAWRQLVRLFQEVWNAPPLK